MIPFAKTISLTVAILACKLSIAGIGVVFPPDKVSVTQKIITIVGTTDDSGEVTVAVTNGVSLAGDRVPVRMGGFSARVQLDHGKNSVSFTTRSGATRTVEIAFGKVQGFTPWFLHATSTKEFDCISCHRVSDEKRNYRLMNSGASTCATLTCHSDFGHDAKYVHGPVAGGVCISCHNPHGSKNKSSLTRTNGEQCFVCHAQKSSDFKQAHQHTPIINGDCVGCHNPHQSNFNFLLRAEGEALCFLCHKDKEKFEKPIKHGPVESGDCLSCHDPHASPYPNQLSADGNNVCFTCHEEKTGTGSLKHPHKPVQEACTKCHQPHSSQNQSLLTKPTGELCYTCHTQVKDVVALAVVPHDPVKNGACTKCHSSHGLNQPKLMNKVGAALCGGCHKEIANKILSSKFRHGPVNDDDCSACHMPHGSKDPKLLIEFFPPAFYNPYREGLYTLCFQCHNGDIARDAQTTQLTNFRDGSRNLHFLHINRRNGRSCIACHDVHASNQPMHIRRSVPFGEMYEYPIAYVQTTDGGNCTTGCHKPKTYSRKLKP